MTPPKPSLVLVATLTVQALVAMALMNVPVVAPAVAEDLGIATTYLGAYVALVYFAAMVATLLGGAAVKRWGAIQAERYIDLLTATFDKLSESPKTAQTCDHIRPG